MVTAAALSHTVAAAMDDASTLGARRSSRRTERSRPGCRVGAVELRSPPAGLRQPLRRAAVGPNRRWLNNGGSLAGVFGEWSAQLTLTLQSGTPLTARLLGAASDLVRGVNGSRRANYDGGPVQLTESDRRRVLQRRGVLDAGARRVRHVGAQHDRRPRGTSAERRCSSATCASAARAPSRCSSTRSTCSTRSSGRPWTRTSTRRPSATCCRRSRCGRSRSPPDCESEMRSPGRVCMKVARQRTSVVAAPRIAWFVADPWSLCRHAFETCRRTIWFAICSLVGSAVLAGSPGQQPPGPPALPERRRSHPRRRRRARQERRTGQRVSPPTTLDLLEDGVRRPIVTFAFEEITRRRGPSRMARRSSPDRAPVRQRTAPRVAPRLDDTPKHPLTSEEVADTGSSRCSSTPARWSPTTCRRRWTAPRNGWTSR